MTDSITTTVAGRGHSMTITTEQFRGVMSCTCGATGSGPRQGMEQSATAHILAARPRGLFGLRTRIAQAIAA